MRAHVLLRICDIKRSAARTVRKSNKWNNFIQNYTQWSPNDSTRKENSSSIFSLQKFNFQISGQVGRYGNLFFLLTHPQSFLPVSLLTRWWEKFIYFSTQQCWQRNIKLILWDFEPLKSRGSTRKVILVVCYVLKFKKPITRKLVKHSTERKPNNNCRKLTRKLKPHMFNSSPTPTRFIVRIILILETLQ